MAAFTDLEHSSRFIDTDEELLQHTARSRDYRWRRAFKVAGLLVLGAALALILEHSGDKFASAGSREFVASDPATLEAFGKLRHALKQLKDDGKDESQDDTKDEIAKKKSRNGKDDNNGKDDKDNKDDKDGKDEKHGDQQPAAKKSGKKFNLFNPFKGVAHFKADATLRKAKAKYSENMAQAFAAAAKMSYCGNLPGIYAGVASSCGAVNLPGITSVCERANLTVTPGFVRTMTSSDLEVVDSIFGYAAKVEPLGDISDLKSGVLIVMRGSIDNFENSYRDKETRMEEGPEGCKGCSVHQGYHQSYHQVQNQLSLILQEFLCKPGSCRLYVTGHGAGAAMASMLAWELSEANYTIGTSYIFGPPQMGDAKFAKAMGDRFSGEGKDGPIFSITHGKDSMPRWPFNATFKSWGIEAYYSNVNATEASQFCHAGTKGCGIKSVPKDELTGNHSCQSPLAPAKDFCQFQSFSYQCYGGVGFQNLHMLPPATPVDPVQPLDSSAATWEPADEDGEQGQALEEEKEATKGQKQSHSAVDFYNLATLKAFSALAKLSYCGKTLGLGNAVQSTCNGAHGVCSKAGFGVAPNSVQAHGISYQSELTEPYYMKDTLFFYTANLRRTTEAFAGAPFFMPSESCVLAIRGSVNEQNMNMNAQLKQIPLNDTACKGCAVNEGVLNAWQKVLETKVLKALKASGCEPRTHKETVRRVFIVGHSMGGTMGTLATYFLHKLGFNVQLSWMLEAGRPGNPAFMDYISNKMLADSRPVAFWQVTHTNDKIPRTGRSIYASGALGRNQHQVHFNTSDTSKPTFCTSKADIAKDSNCGIYQFERSQLANGIPNDAHCALPFAPKSQMCMLEYSTEPAKYSLASQCYWGGAMSE